MATKPALALNGFKFTARIDYLSLTGIDKTSLPHLHGKPCWPKATPGKLTVHDASPADVGLLAETFQHGFIDELEVCVDIAPAKPLPPDEHDAALKVFKAEYIAKRLKPSFAEGTNSGFRGAYDHALHKTIPFNHRVPKAHQQHLHGHRNDGVQVKCYYKRRDQHKDLRQDQHRVRVEVRLGRLELDRLGLLHTPDLLNFKFRKKLMQYFTHVYGSRRAKPRKNERKPLLKVLYDWKDAIDSQHWDLVGVGAFERGGKREQPNLIFKRDTELNNRIGQALGRLERSFAVKKFVRPAVPA